MVATIVLFILSNLDELVNIIRLPLEQLEGG